MKQINYDDVISLSNKFKTEISAFLRDMIAIPSESCQEEKVVKRIKEEMEKVGFDDVRIDMMGNIIGRIGTGSTVIAMDAHIDTVGIGDKSLWDYDPYKGYEDDEIIIGRGGTDQEGGMASMVYAGKIIKELGLDDDYTLLVTGTVQEEDCDGLCWQHLVEKEGLKPEFVVITEPTNCNIYRGQRGRMEIKVGTKGLSCHGSAPERGENAIFKMAPILIELEKLNEDLHVDEFLGKGTLTVSEVHYTSPSRCAVADSCNISIDRRLTWGETWEGAIKEIQKLESVKDAGATVDMYNYDRASYTGYIFETECYFPAWKIEEDHIATEALVASYKKLFNTDPLVDKWTFSTNGVSIMGRYGIPCIGFGPGKEEEAHAPNEKTWKDHLVRCAAMYSIIPNEYLKIKNNKI